MADLSVVEGRCADFFDLFMRPCANDQDEERDFPDADAGEGPLKQAVEVRRRLAALLSGDHPSVTLDNIDLDVVPGVSIGTLVEARAELLRRAGDDAAAAALETQHRHAVRAIRQDLFLQGRVKLNLLEWLAVEHVAVLMAIALEVNKPPALRQRTRVGMGDFVRRFGSHYAEFDMPVSFTVAAPIVFGSHRGCASEAVGRTAFVGAVPNAIVRHRSSMITVDGHLLLDATDEELKDIPLVLHVDPSVIDLTGDTVVTLDEPSCLHLREAVHLGGVPSRAFGHWIYQFLPKFFGARFSGHLPRVPILIDAHMPPSHRQALSYFLDDETEIIEIPELSTVRIDRLWVLSDWTYVPFCPMPGHYLGPKRLSPPPLQMATVVRAMLAGRPTPQRRVAKLFLARHAFRHRRMTNHERVMEIAIELGFHVVYLEEHPFATQIELIRSAERIVGPDGSSHILCMFAQPRTKLTMLTHGFIENNASLFAIFAALDLDAIMLQGRCVQENKAYPRFSDYEIDEDAFREVAKR